MNYRNSKMLDWYISKINEMKTYIKKGIPFPNYFYTCVYEALEEYYYLRDEESRLKNGLNN